MSKEFEALQDLLMFACVMSENMVGLTKGNYDEKEFVNKTYEYLKKYIKNFECRDILKQALNELKEIKEANPTKALELVYCLKSYLMNMMPYYDWLNDIEKYILKSQKQEKAWEIVREKRVDLPYLRCCIEDNQNVERYNEYIGNKTMDYDHEQELTEQEFDLLKEMLE